MTTSDIPLVLRTSQAMILVCFGSIKGEGSAINALIEASNAWILCSLLRSCTLHPGISCNFQPEKLQKRLPIMLIFSSPCCSVEYIFAETSLLRSGRLAAMGELKRRGSENLPFIAESVLSVCEETILGIHVGEGTGVKITGQLPIRFTKVRLADRTYLRIRN